MWFFVAEVRDSEGQPFRAIFVNGASLKYAEAPQMYRKLLTFSSPLKIPRLDALAILRPVVEL